jgi:hypothetical protein
MRTKPSWVNDKRFTGVERSEHARNCVLTKPGVAGEGLWAFHGPPRLAREAARREDGSRYPLGACASSRMWSTIPGKSGGLWESQAPSFRSGAKLEHRRGCDRTRRTFQMREWLVSGHDESKAATIAGGTGVTATIRWAGGSSRRCIGA